MVDAIAPTFVLAAMSLSLSLPTMGVMGSVDFRSSSAPPRSILLLRTANLYIVLLLYE